MVLGPLSGLSRTDGLAAACPILGDVVRAIASLGLVLVDGVRRDVFLALLAGVGDRPVHARGPRGTPKLGGRAAATCRDVAIRGYRRFRIYRRDRGSGGAILWWGPETILAVNAIAFALSALALAMLRFGEAPVGRNSRDPPDAIARGTGRTLATAGMAGCA